MVRVVLKGLLDGKTFPIAEFKGGVVLLEDGGIQITLSSKDLSARLRVFFRDKFDGVVQYE